MAARAQTDAPVAAPVETVTTTAIPSAGPVYVAPDAAYGQPLGGWDMQAPVTELGRQAYDLTFYLLNPMMAAVAIFVLILLLYAMWRFRASANPVASKTSHNTTIEFIWTAAPVLLLAIIAVPSFRLLADQYDPPAADLTIKATGHQWYWEYEYPDQGGFSFDAVMLTDTESAERGSPKLLDTDNRVVVPVGATVKILTTASDVMHSFAMPSFWVKMDAVPGRINETWFKVEREGVYFGQCSELCGTKHAFMPIAIEVVSQPRFDAWIAAKQAENGITPELAEAPAAAVVPVTATDTPAAAPAAATTAAAPAAAPAA
ncbi:cytochrome c oxidase subunit 2 [Polymorphobacter multimanifer]|nr:cytochrome c oxidase subunit 2 [Polymorphobacter multimanifer]